jgi:hypothetical protein
MEASHEKDGDDAAFGWPPSYESRSTLNGFQQTGDSGLEAFDRSVRPAEFGRQAKQLTTLLVGRLGASWTDVPELRPWLCRGTP